MKTFILFLFVLLFVQSVAVITFTESEGFIALSIFTIIFSGIGIIITILSALDDQYNIF